jgi:hypothetical protein
VVYVRYDSNVANFSRVLFHDNKNSASSSA